VPVYALGDLVPEIDATAWVAAEAVVIGAVSIGPGSTIWPTAVLRGDDGRIVIGAETSVQDGAVLHTLPHQPTTVGDRCTIGHLAHLEGCTVEDDALVGTGAIVLHHAIVGARALVGAGALVPNRMHVPPDTVAVGVPAKVRDGMVVDLEYNQQGAQRYVARGARFRAELRRIG
jgi:carbonic anhydrase/acetyltransferase-like protein (isoleucine patch superfamily)